MGKSPTWLLVYVCADGWCQIHCNTVGQDFSHISSGCLLLVSSLSMSGSLFHLAVFRRSRKHKENRQSWGAPGDLMLHIDVWNGASSYGCQKLSLERENAPTSSYCTTVNKETEVWDNTVWQYMLHWSRDFALEQYQHALALGLMIYYWCKQHY